MMITDERQVISEEDVDDVMPEEMAAQLIHQHEPTQMPVASGERPPSRRDTQDRMDFMTQEDPIEEINYRQDLLMESQAMQNQHNQRINQLTAASQQATTDSAKVTFSMNFNRYATSVKQKQGNFSVNLRKNKAGRRALATNLSHGEQAYSQGKMRSQESLDALVNKMIEIE